MLKRNLNRNAANIIRKVASPWPPENNTFEHSKKNLQEDAYSGILCSKDAWCTCTKKYFNVCFPEKKLSE